MELFSVHKTFQHTHPGEEKQQMLNLNRRLETYLSRVKHLEEENALLAKDIQAMRRSNQGASSRRRGLEEELHRGRLEVDAAWRDRVYTEMEVGKLVEQLHVLDLQRQREAQAQLEAKMKLERSRKELEEEQRAQIWLREKVSQLENEMRHLIQTHEQDVAHLEATLNLSRSTMPPMFAQRSNQNQNLLELGYEYSQRAKRARQEATEAYQGQLAQLEESLNQARSRLTRVDQEKRESQLKLQALEKELASAEDVREHLEKTATQQGQRYSQEIQELQEHLEGLEAKKEQLGEQIERILVENRGLLQAKLSLGLEVATYRALLDNDSFTGNIPQRHISITDAAFSPRGVTKNHRTQLSARYKTTSLSSVRTTTPVWSRKPVSLTAAPKISMKSAFNVNAKAATSESLYPKILQDGAVENFRPQEVHEKVTYAEPLSPPNEQEALHETTSEEKAGEEEWKKVDVGHAEGRPFVESDISYQVESGLSSEPPFKDEVRWHQFDTPNLTPYSVRIKEEPYGFSEESDVDVPLDKPVEKQEKNELCAPVAAWEERKATGEASEHLQEETSDSETEAVIEPNFGSRTSSQVSECEPEEGGEENIFELDAVEVKQETSCSTEDNKEMDVEDKLYPDGEEMDTWDSVIERKVELNDEGIKTDEEKLQHAEPEEDISAREQEHGKRNVQHKNGMASPMMHTEDDGHHSAFDQEEHAPLSDKEDEDSQNVSVSWRTELEGDSFAQDNTLADTRPLIRYKSDETDANTHASHIDESESSEGEQEKNAGETGSGTWGEGKSKRFGTMEDLCEEVEGDGLDEDYDLGYTHTEDQFVGLGVTGSEDATESVEDSFRKVSEGDSDVGYEVHTKAIPPNVDYDEELETDKLVEEELENLATERYSAHFAQRQISRIEDVLHPQRRSVEETTETEDMTSCAEPDVTENNEPASFTTTTAQPLENVYSSGSSLVMPQRETDKLVQHEEQDAAEQNVWMVTHADPTGDQTGFSKLLRMPDVRENSEEPRSVSLVTADQENLQDMAASSEVEKIQSVEASAVSQEHVIKDFLHCEGFPDVPDSSEWDVLESQFEIRHQNEGHETCDNMPESAESFLHSDKDSDGGGLMETFPEGVPDKYDIIRVKDSEELLNTNGKDKAPCGFFSSGVQSDLWMSSLETGATYQPAEACNEGAEQTNKNQGYADSSAWGILDDPKVVNKNSKVDIDSTKALNTRDTEQGQMFPEVKQLMHRNDAEGEFVHSEESEVDAESWSSEDEKAV
ncbi:LOW QUALITY PROTEIN: nestin [Tautogolabrus adspersus]